MVRRRRPQVRRQKRSMEYLWPFLLIIFGGIILVLVIQFAWSFLDQREVDLKNKIYFDLDGGGAEILPWGQTEWTKAYDNQLVLEGDMLSMERESRGTLEFYNKTHVRMDEETKVNVEAIDTDDDMDQIKLVLRSGTVWLNVDSESDDSMQMVVMTDNLRITSYGTIFEVGLTDRETVRVLEGEVLVEVLEPDSDRGVVLEQMKVGVGQEIEVTSSDMATMVERQPVSLLAALSDEWKITDWYTWNTDEDERLLAGVTDDEQDNVADDHSSAQTIATVTLEGELPDEEEVVTEEETITEEEEVNEDQDLTPPVVKVSIPVVSPRTLSEEDDDIPYFISGTASANTASITVTSYSVGGAASPYTLQHFDAGDATWRYGASNTYGNLREGRNMFTVMATSEAGVKSEPIEVIIIVPEGFFTADEEEAEVVEEDASTVTTEEDTTNEEATTTTPDDPLTTPSVTSLNGDSLRGTYETSADSVLVLGTVSSSTVAVYVNDFKLTKFVPGSGEWSYYAQDIHGNYATGTNTYTVYAEDKDGNMSSGFTFEIYRIAP